MSYDEQKMQSCYEQPNPLPPMFRAKDKDGLWVYGSYHYSADGKHHYILELNKFIRGFDQRGEDDPDRVCMFSAEVHDIDPATVENVKVDDAVLQTVIEESEYERGTIQGKLFNEGQVMLMLKDVGFLSASLRTVKEMMWKQERKFYRDTINATLKLLNKWNKKGEWIDLKERCKNTLELGQKDE